MSASRTYLDHNASAPLRPEAREAMLLALDIAGNPSSVHAEGRQARAIVERAREEVARLVGARAEDVVFTSGGTEACNMALSAGWDTVALAPIEHAAVTAPARRSGAVLLPLEVGSDGVVASPEPDALRAAIGRKLLVLQRANNETGVLQSVAEIAALARAHAYSIFSDVTQAAGKVAIDISALGADMIALSAHKLGGPKGIGALVLRHGYELPAGIVGGGQERGRRAGTENVAGIAGFGAAARAAMHDLTKSSGIARLRDRLVSGVRQLTPGAVVIGGTVDRLPGTACIAWPEAKAETLVIALDLEGIAISAGAACSSGKVGRSAALEAMRLPVAIRDGAIRVSLGWSSRDEDVERFLAAWARVTARLETRRVA